MNLPVRSVEGSRVLSLAMIASFIALSSALRLVKHLVIGPVQFVNFPAVFTILGGLRLGGKAGFLIGVMSFLVSDLIMGFAGPWTIATSLSMGLIGALSSVISRVDDNISLIGLGISSYLLILTYDILSSVILLIPSLPLHVAFFSAIIGLFLPSSIVFYPVGIATEIVTVFLIVLIHPQIKKVWRNVRL